MAEGTFSDLPEDLFASLKPNWATSVNPADALLGISIVPPTPEPQFGILELSDDALAATDSDFSKVRQERDTAISNFAREFANLSRKKKDCTEEKVDELLKTYFDDAFIPLTPENLQAVTDELTTSWGEIKYSRFFTAWSDRLRQQGDTEPSLVITWPERRSHTYTDFGPGMRNVDLTIIGNFKGALGEKAVDCYFEVEDFDGMLLKEAQNCIVTADSVEAGILTGASNSSVYCDKLSSPYIKIDNGCKLEAATVDCTTISKATKPKDTEPCEIAIGHLRGTIKPGANWVVSIEETTEPIRRQRSMGFAENIEFSSENVQNEVLKYPKPHDEYKNISNSKSEQTFPFDDLLNNDRGKASTSRLVFDLSKHEEFIQLFEEPKNTFELPLLPELPGLPEPPELLELPELPESPEMRMGRLIVANFFKRSTEEPDL